MVNVVDAQSPVIENCPESQTLFVGANVDYAIATWDTPTATDNVDDVVAVSLMEGQESGSQFPVGDVPNNVYQIVYGAEDAAGSVAIDCEFAIIVQGNYCS